MSLLLPVVLLVFTQAASACDDDLYEQFPTTRQGSDDYWADAYGYVPHQQPFNFPYYQQQNDFVPSDRVMSYQGRNSLSRPKFSSLKPLKNYFTNENNEEYDRNGQPEGRYGIAGLKASLINTGLFNNRFTPANTWRPFSNLADRSPITINPNFENPISSFDACKSPNGEAGICAPGNICSLFGGRPSGSCVLGKVCCINAITSCGGSVTLNNTFWQSPATVSAPSTCSLTVKLDAKFVEQKRPICQLRLDLVSFTTAQPTAGTCTDTFQVGGSTSSVPIICGDNSGQHMYIDVPSSATIATDVQLMFNFAAGAGTTTRSWNIKIAMLPCGASYLAPKDCLQYFSSASGTIKSFNWQDVAVAATRQLNNQNYNICFRTEEIDKQVSSRMCFSTCAVTNGGAPFSLTTAAVAGNSAVGTIDAANLAVCLYDFLLIAGGTDPATGLAADRFCGEQFNPVPAGAAASVPVCSRIKPFRIIYQTDATEAAITAVGTVIAATADANNAGFCLDFQERTN
ncbi:hypothetical protein DAPPUDRAFT_240663 [Daphnia pulex]|uniref:CUB domain-containing protein n=1 Tax=Daphnia pulex TaxID=6669 RepID=E9GC67_DAPPU|nr:hypothetical protein DAPPUDRAFT_240663 [Daphnia pulex]|eukprot:EFX82915.1 hypothetical protein DAPPUDRAFT_240663 [Daphnia pulex]